MEENQLFKQRGKLALQIFATGIFLALLLGGTRLVPNYLIPSTKDSANSPHPALAGPPILWNTTWGGAGDDEPTGTWGNGTWVYSVGYSNSYSSSYDVVLIARDASTGALLWNVSWGGTGDDEVYSVWGDGNRIYAAGTTTSYTAGSYDFAVIAWDATTGARLWNNTWGGAGSDYANGIWGDGDRVFTVGVTDSFGTLSADLALVAWNAATGARVWNVTWGGTQSDSGTSIWGDGTRIFTAGDTYSYGAGFNDFVLIAWDPDTGARLWISTWGGPGFDKGESVWGDGTTIYVVGGTTSFGAGNDDAALVAWNATSGVRLWNVTWGGTQVEVGFCVWGDATHIYTGGKTDSFGAGSYDFFIVVWNPLDATFLWSTTWGGIGDDEAFSLWWDGTRLYVAGVTTSLITVSNDFALVAWDVHFSITHPPDFLYVEGTTGHGITWDISSATNPQSSYVVLCNGAPYASGTWVSNTPVVISVDNLPVGVYSFTIIATEITGVQISDTVKMIVVANLWSFTNILLVITAATFGLLLIAILARRYSPLKTPRELPGRDKTTK